jgi:hypothetical protein
VSKQPFPAQVAGQDAVGDHFCGPDPRREIYPQKLVVEAVHLCLLYILDFEGMASLLSTGRSVVDNITLLAYQKYRRDIPEMLEEVLCPNGNRWGLSGNRVDR